MLKDIIILIELQSLRWTTKNLTSAIICSRELTDILNTLQGVIILVIFLRQQNKRKLVVDLLHRFAGHAQTAARKISTVNDTTSTFLSEKLEDTDKETVEKIRKLSKMEETAAGIIVTSLNQIDMKEIKNKGECEKK